MNPPPDTQIEKPVSEIQMTTTRRGVVWKIASATSVLVLIALGIHLFRSKATAEAVAAPVASVAVTKVVRDNLSRDLVFDAEFCPYHEIELHAKVAGYLEDIQVDVGDPVKAGQIIATLEIPELESDLEHAVAVEKRAEQEVKRADAAYQQAHLAYSRLIAVDKSQPHLLAQQDIDAANTQEQSTSAALAAAKLAVEEAQANVKKLETTVKYSKITAPFAGVITKRFADPGALIQAGLASSTQSMPLVRLSQLDRLRLVFPISISYVSRIHVNDPVEIRVQSSNQRLNAKVTRFTESIETSTRTMEAEVDVDNANLTLLPGMYASVVLRPDHRENTLVVPVEAVSRKGNPTVFVVNKSGELEQRSVTLGLETPAKAEVITGLDENDFVVIGNRSQLNAGQKVNPKPVDLGSL